MAGTRGEVLHVPLRLGAVAVAYNLPDVVEELRFTGPVLADIYLGKITKWNDPALMASNPAARLPDLPITVVYHREPTGTTILWPSSWADEPGLAATGPADVELAGRRRGRRRTPGRPRG